MSQNPNRASSSGSTPREPHVELLTIVFTDMVDSTWMQHQHGAVAADKRLTAHKTVVRRLLRAHGTREVSWFGDSCLATFSRPSDAIRFSLTLQGVLHAERERDPGTAIARIAVHLGEVLVREDQAGQIDLQGLQVSETARYLDAAAGGQILCSRAIFDNARQHVRAADQEVVWLSHGPYIFKGVGAPLEVCEVGLSHCAPLHPPPSGAKCWPADTAPEETGWRPAPGAEVPRSRWQIRRRLGAGAHGEVWLAVHRDTEQYQALKFCFRRERVEWLRREARVLAELQQRLPAHQNLVHFNGVVADPEQPPSYIMMEYVKGPTLPHYLASSVPPLSRRVELIAEIADALQAIHSEDVVHCDVQPANILLSERRDGTLVAKLGDFGTYTAGGLPREGGPDGERPASPSNSDYVAPELRAGAPPSPASDIFALGISLYQVVVGDVKRPLASGWQRDVESPVLRQVIERATDIQPDKRYHSAEAMAYALRTLRETERTARLERERTMQMRRQRRLRRILGFGAGVLAGLAVLSAALFVQWDQARVRQLEAETARQQAQQQQVAAERARQLA